MRIAGGGQATFSLRSGEQSKKNRRPRRRRLRPIVWVALLFLGTLLLSIHYRDVTFLEEKSSHRLNLVSWEDAFGSAPAKSFPSEPQKTAGEEFQLSSSSASSFFQLAKDRYNYHPPILRTKSERDRELEECGTAPDFRKFFDQNDQVHSHRGEDETIYKLFFKDALINGNKNNFTYLELGAFNGLRESNTRFFDVCLGWDGGILIEANPLKIPKLVESRPHANRLNYAPSCPSDDAQSIDFYSVSFTNAAQANVPAAQQFQNDNQAVKVPCGRLGPAIQHLAEDGHVHFASLDVEGAELQVLQTIDFASSTILVDIWIIENTNLFCKRREACESREQVRQLMNKVGYVGFDNVVTGSDLFVLSTSPYYDKTKRAGLKPSSWNRLIT